MKKITVLLLALMCSISFTFAQQVTKKVDKVKKTTTLPQKVHNVFSKHKHYSGTKTKHVVKVEKAKPTN